MTRLRQRLDLPLEHGAWGMVIVPFLIGALAAGSFRLPVVLTGAVSLLAFSSRPSIVKWWRSRRRGRVDRAARKRSLLYLALAATGGLPLLAVYRLWGLLPLGGVVAVIGGLHVRQVLQGREDRSIGGEILAIAGMCLSAPAAHYAATGEWTPEAAWLYGLCVLYFASSVFYIKLRVRTAHPGKGPGPGRLRGALIAYHLGLLLMLALLAGTGRLHALAAVAFAPVLVRALWFGFRPGPELRLKRLGLLEVAYSFVFLVLVAVAFTGS